jgi:hypothetical protein
MIDFGHDEVPNEMGLGYLTAFAVIACFISVFLCRAQWIRA